MKGRQGLIMTQGDAPAPFAHIAPPRPEQQIPPLPGPVAHRNHCSPPYHLFPGPARRFHPVAPGSPRSYRGFHNSLPVVESTRRSVLVPEQRTRPSTTLWLRTPSRSPPPSQAIGLI